MTLHWSAKTTPAELNSMLTTLAADYPLVQGNGAGVSVHFARVGARGTCAVKLKGKSAIVRYATAAQAARAVGALLSGLVKENAIYQETTSFSTLGIMLDCSRNAVMTVPHTKVWLNRLALLGYNMLMLYTEDTYELPGEPYFGYQRGAYTADELQQIDAHAARLNIEVVPCIQTLGHLANVVRHPAYARVKDTSSVMLVGQKQTYDLVEKMIAHWAKMCRSKRIHVGMDETHDLGRGRYLDLFGYRPGVDLFNEHLQRVVKICMKHGLKPMIWSDMYFSLGSKSGDYYDTAATIPQAVINKIPKEAELVYWDYYHNDKQFYLNMLKTHRGMGKQPLMASGIWTWNKYWYDRRLTEANASACIEACRAACVPELIFTMWGDNGAYCDHDSAFAGMVYCADKAYGTMKPAPARLQKRFAAVCRGSYAAHMLASDLHGAIKGFQPNMWDDPLFETHIRTCTGDKPRRMAELAHGFAALAKKLKPHVREREAGDLRYAYCTTQAFADRYGLAAELLAAYRGKDKQALRLILKKIPAVQKSIGSMAAAFRAMWLKHNKPLGMEWIQGRFGMLTARYQEMAQRIKDLQAGIVSGIAELDIACPPK